MKRSKIVLGMMRLNPLTPKDLEEVIAFSLENGINSFDLSDVYGRHTAESKFGEVMKMHPEWRKDMLIQTKCGIVKEEGKQTYMDLSKEHILSSLDDSLERMHLDYLDSYLLHRVDIFMDSKEISEAFDKIEKEKKVKNFGVSNMNVEQIEYLKTDIKQPLILDQLQVGLGQLSLISQNFNVNAPDQGVNLQDGIFFYLKRKKMILQCWSPFVYGLFKSTIFQEESMAKTRDILSKLAKKYNVSISSIAVSFLTMLGDNVEVLIGSMNKDHIKEALDGANLKLTKQEWYELYCSTGNMLP